MLLIGMFDSPFVRRVAISMKLLGVPFEHANWSVGKDFGLQELEKIYAQRSRGAWFLGDAMTQADHRPNMSV